MTIYPNMILDALRTVRYPGTGRDIVDMGMVNDDIRIDGNRVSFSLTFEKPTDPFIKSVVKAAEAAILALLARPRDPDSRARAPPQLLAFSRLFTFQPSAPAPGAGFSRGPWQLPPS